MPNAQCPMPNAQCPMPNAQCPIVPHVTEKGYISQELVKFDTQLTLVKSPSKNPVHLI